jgi:ribosomal protein S18 acetylase RimI-like enzyme
VEFVVDDAPDPDDLDLIDAEIRAAASAATDLGDQRDLAVLVREDGRLRAGIYGWTWGDCCELQSLWVAPELRGSGLGLRLLTEAEHEARARGCRQIVIFVHDFQPLALYRRFGLEELARVTDFPEGSSAIWMRKAIGDSAPRNL